MSLPDNPVKELTRARFHVRAWLEDERELYADKKYPLDSEVQHKLLLDMLNFGLDEHSEAMVFIGNYLKRAQLLGLDTLQGRQAFGKLIVTCLGYLERAVVVHGDMPKPGLESGNLEEW